MRAGPERGPYPTAADSDLSRSLLQMRSVRLPTHRGALRAHRGLHANGHNLRAARGIGIAVHLLMLRVKTAHEIAPGDVQLVALSGVPDVGRALDTAAGHIGAGLSLE